MRRYVAADGTVREYRYPARTAKDAPGVAADSLAALIVAFRNSPKFDSLRPSSRRVYERSLRWLEPINEMPARALKRPLLLDIRDAIAKQAGNATANLFSSVVSVLLNWGVDRGKIEFNPGARVDILDTGHLPAWTEQDYALAVAHLPEYLRRLVVLNGHIGQRRGDLIGLRWSNYDGARLQFVQEKTGAELKILVAAELKAELDAWRREATSLHILTNATGRPWTKSNVTETVPRALARIPGIRPGLNIHGLRKLAATRYAEAGCSALEIAAITGHKSLAMVSLYTKSAEQERLANAAVIRLGKIGRNSDEDASTG